MDTKVEAKVDTKVESDRCRDAVPVSRAGDKGLGSGVWLTLQRRIALEQAQMLAEALTLLRSQGIQGE